MAPQIADTSTVYENIVTQIWNVVDCRYCTVTNVADNPAAVGPFTARTTKPVLTVSQVGCMPETTAITRRDVRGFEDLPSPKFVAPSVRPARPEHRHAPLVDRQSGLGNTTSNHTIPQLSGEAALLIRELVTAEYSLAMLTTPGIDAMQLCTSLREAYMLQEGGGLNSINIDPNQAADIVCFAAYYGIDLNSTTPQLLGNLSAAIIAIDLQALFNLTAQASDFCTAIDYSPLPELGVDGDAVSSYICSDSFPTTSSVPPHASFPASASATASNSASTSAAVSTVGASNPWQSGTAPRATGLSGTAPMETGTGRPAASGSGMPGPYGNSTAHSSTEIGPPVSATGTGQVPYDNGTSYSSQTSSDSWSIDWPSTTPERKAPPKPRKPNVYGYYPAFETSTVPAWYRGY